MQTTGNGARLTLGMALCAALISTGCESVVDCLDNDGPEFNTGSVSDPILNQVYSQTISVSIKNEPRDDNFRYQFRRTGRLPAGVTGVGIGRRFILDGTATEEGTFMFTVHVNVDDSLDPAESGLCFYNASRDYEITVQPR